MTQTTWKEGVDSSVCPLYVSPLYPKKGETVSITLQIPYTNEVKGVRLVAFQLGREKQHVSMRKTEGNRDLYTATIQLEDSLLSWYFFIIADDRAYSYSLAGVQASVPPIRECFSLRSDLEAVDWVGSAVCYQIFPDRFRKGTAETGARDGMYSFDGGTVSVHSFDEAPLSYEQGRCLDFYNGDLAGIEKSVDHFKKLGVTALYLNPIGMSRTTHRYDCTDFFHVDDKLGGDEAYAGLCNTVHANDMRLIVDISINHTGTEHPWFKKAQEDPGSREASYYYYLDDHSVACWQDVPTLPQLNYTSNELRNLIYRSPDSVLRSFLKSPYNQDGWRFDVASEVGRRGKDQLCEEIWREVRTVLKQENSQAYLVGEDWVDSTCYLQGDMWDATMNYLGSSRPMRSWMGETDRFLTEGWGHSPKATRPFTGDEFAHALESQLNSVPAQMLSMQMNLINSHDTPRLYENTEVFNRPMYQGIVRLLYLLPGMPNIYYGEEIGLAGPYGSVEAARYPMQWNQDEWKREFFSLYTSLGAFRKQHAEILSKGAWAILYSDEYSIAFARYTEKTAIILILSNKKETHNFIVPNAKLQLESVSVQQGTGSAWLTKEGISVALEDRESLLLVGNR